MANDISYLAGVPPRERELWSALSDLVGDAVSVVIDRPNITVAANDTWEYVVPFRLVSSRTGLVLPYSGTVGAAVVLSTGSGPTPVVSSATPSVLFGSGTVTVGHGDTGYQAGDVSTLTITYTNMQGATDTDTFTVTMS